MLRMSENSCKIKIQASSAREEAIYRCWDPPWGSAKLIPCWPASPLTPLPLPFAGLTPDPSPKGEGEEKNCPPFKRGSQLSYSGIYSDWSQKVSLVLNCFRPVKFALSGDV